MKSRLAELAEQQLIEAARRMTPEQRLGAFIEHSKRMVQLQRAGRGAAPSGNNRDKPHRAD
jgi:hypothetical protein